MTYAEAIGKYGTDKPDLRFDLPLCDLTEVVRRHDGGGVEMFKAALASGRAMAWSRAGGCRPSTPAGWRAARSTSWRSSPRGSARAGWRARASGRTAPGRRRR